MAHYTLLRLSDLHDIVSYLAVARSKNPLADVRSIDDLPACDLIDFETGKALPLTDTKGVRYVSVGQELSEKVKRKLLSRAERHCQQEIDSLKEFLGL